MQPGHVLERRRDVVHVVRAGLRVSVFRHDELDQGAVRQLAAAGLLLRRRQLVAERHGVPSGSVHTGRRRAVHSVSRWSLRIVVGVGIVHELHRGVPVPWRRSDVGHAVAVSRWHIQHRGVDVVQPLCRGLRVQRRLRGDCMYCRQVQQRIVVNVSVVSRGLQLPHDCGGRTDTMYLGLLLSSVDVVTCCMWQWCVLSTWHRVDVSAVSCGGRGRRSVAAVVDEQHSDARLGLVCWRVSAVARVDVVTCCWNMGVQ
jgi:hypothetical protein